MVVAWHPTTFHETHRQHTGVDHSKTERLPNVLREWSSMHPKDSHVIKPIKRYAAAFEGKMHDVMHARAHTMTGLLSKVQSELEGTIRPLDRAIKEALDLGQDFEGLDEATHYAANPWLTLLGGAQVRSLIEAHHGLAHVAHPSLLKMCDLTDKVTHLPMRSDCMPMMMYLNEGRMRVQRPSVNGFL